MPAGAIAKHVARQAQIWRGSQSTMTRGLGFIPDLAGVPTPQ